MTDVPPHVMTWLSGGTERTVTTAHNDGESIEDWRIRHQTAVDFWQIIYPVD